MGGKNLLDTGLDQGYRHCGHLDMLALPVGCKVAARQILKDMHLHSALLWNVTGGTSSLRNNQGIGKRP